MRQRLANSRWDVGTHRKDEFQAGTVIRDVAKDEVLKVQTGEGSGRDRYSCPGCRKARSRDEVGSSLGCRKRNPGGVRETPDDVDEADVLMKLGDNDAICSDITRAYCGYCSQGMIGRNSDNYVLFMNDPGENPLRIGRSRSANTNVDPTVMYCRNLLGGFKRNRLHFNFREFAPKQANNVGQDARHDRRKYIANLQWARRPSAELASQQFGSLERGNSGTRLGKEEFARTGQGDLVPLAAFYQARSDLIFETFEPLAHDRLGDAKSIGRSREMFKIGDCGKCAQGIRIEHAVLFSYCDQNCKYNEFKRLNDCVRFAGHEQGKHDG